MRLRSNGSSVCELVDAVEVAKIDGVRVAELKLDLMLCVFFNGRIEWVDEFCLSSCS